MRIGRRKGALGIADQVLRLPRDHQFLIGCDHEGANGTQQQLPIMIK